MPDAKDAGTLTGTALLERLRRQLAARRDPVLFRVVEVARDAHGRVVRRGQVWHADLDHVRRFGHALAANSCSQQVLVKDAAGTTLERIAVASAAAPAGWSGWRDAPLPPLRPPLRKSRPPVRQTAAEADIDIDPVA